MGPTLSGSLATPRSPSPLIVAFFGALLPSSRPPFSLVSPLTRSLSVVLSFACSLVRPFARSPVLPFSRSLGVLSVPIVFSMNDTSRRWQTARTLAVCSRALIAAPARRDSGAPFHCLAAPDRPLACSKRPPRPFRFRSRFCSRFCFLQRLQASCQPLESSLFFHEKV